MLFHWLRDYRHSCVLDTAPLVHDPGSGEIVRLARDDWLRTVRAGSKRFIHQRLVFVLRREHFESVFSHAPAVFGDYASLL